jgi:hypothetical protein
MAVFNKYQFTNVATPLAVLQNIANSVVLNGWTIDKFDNTNLELYIHSTGNGSQNLYYSMKYLYYSGSYGTYYYLQIYGNLGFNGSSAYSAQPGVFSSGYNTLMPFHNPAQFPLMTQWVFANQNGILVFLDGNFNIVYSSVYPFKGRWIVPIFMGSIESYKSGETEGNILITSKAMNVNGGPVVFSIWSGANDGSYSSGDLYYLSAGRIKGAVSSTVSLARACVPAGSYGYISVVQNRGYSYNWAVKMSSYTNKAPIIKPIISLSYAISGYNYFHPIGELPYYATAGYPYFLPGDTTYYGQRKFTIIEMGDYQSPYGVAIETGN